MADQLLGPVEGSPYIGGTPTGLVFVGSDGKQATDGPQWDGSTFAVGPAGDGTGMVQTGLLDVNIPTASGVGLSIEHAATPSGDYLQLTTNGGIAGDVFKVDSAGDITASGNITLSGASGAVLSNPFSTVLANSGGLELYHLGNRSHYLNWDAHAVRSDAYIGFDSVTSVGQGQGDANLYRVGAAHIGICGTTSATPGDLTVGDITASGELELTNGPLSMGSLDTLSYAGSTLTLGNAAWSIFDFVAGGGTVQRLTSSLTTQYQPVNYSVPAGDVFSVGGVLSMTYADAPQELNIGGVAASSYWQNLNLYAQGTKVVNVNNTGIDVTGGITASGDITVGTTTIYQAGQVTTPRVDIEGLGVLMTPSGVNKHLIRNTATDFEIYSYGTTTNVLSIDNATGDITASGDLSVASTLQAAEIYAAGSSSATKFTVAAFTDGLGSTGRGSIYYGGNKLHLAYGPGAPPVISLDGSSVSVLQDISVAGDLTASGSASFSSPFRQVTLRDSDSTAAAFATAYQEYYHGEVTRLGYSGMLSGGVFSISTTIAGGSFEVRTGNNVKALEIDDAGDITASGNIASGATANGTGQVTQSAEVATTDATVTSLWTLTTVSDTIYQVRATVIATETTDHDEAASYELIATFKNDGGTLTQVGTTTVAHSAEDTAGWDAVFDVSAGDIRVRVTGAAATNVSWHGIVNYAGIA